MSDTIGVYDRMSADYVALTKDDAPPELAEFIAAVRPGGRVLDLGCGPGQHAARMAAAGLDVLAVDGAGEMVALAAAMPGVTARQATFDEIVSLGPVDGIWASFSLLHAPRAAFARHLADMRGICRPNAVIALGMKLGQGEGSDHLGRFYSYYSEAELRGLLGAAGFNTGAARLGAGKGLAGTVDDWIVLTATAT